MKYLIIDPLFNSSGIGAYTKFLSYSLESLGIDFEVIGNSKNLSPINFRKYVFDYITRNFGFDDVIIEAPEAKASTLLLPKRYRIHIRLHCPLAIAQKYDNQDINQQEYSNELRVINKAAVVSSPSYGLLKELKNEISDEKIFVYKNPISLKLDEYKQSAEKQYDVVFMGRMQYLKGCDYIRKIIEKLPANYNVLVFGNNADRLKLGVNYKCNVDVRMQIESSKKFEVISKSKVLMQLSRFENCSMVILESLSVATPVVCWNVGGNAEISGNGTVVPVTDGDVNELVYNLKNLVNTTFSQRKFSESLNNVNNDFKQGIHGIIDYINSSKISNIYKGLNYTKDALKHVKRMQGIDVIGLYPPKKIFGIGYSNEHIEELWAPFVNALGAEYRYVCRQKMGYHTVFDGPNCEINKQFYCMFDWLKEPERLIKQIINYKPNLILFHNGSHPNYEHILPIIRKLGIPIIYSELGWFPQKNNVYFDSLGVNGKSNLAKMSYEELTKIKDKYIESNEFVTGDYHFVATQLDNDTNIIINSERFKSRNSFLTYVINSIDANEKIYIKVHPKDRLELASDIVDKKNVTIVNDDISNILINAKSVIAINSTVLLQALEYNCNIYYCGNSILDNKGVAQKFDCNELNGIISNKLYCKLDKKLTLVESLKRHQVNVIDAIKMNKTETISNVGLNPFFNLDLMDFTNLSKLSKNVLLVKEEKKEIASSLFPLKTKDMLHVNTKEELSSRIKPKYIKTHSVVKLLTTKEIRRILPYHFRSIFFEKH